MAAEFSTNYLINVTLGNLKALDVLLKQLSNIRDLAQKGADFQLRVDPTALNGLEKTIADRVAKGAADGLGDVLAGPGARRERTTSDAAPSTRRPVDDQALIRSMRSLTDVLTNVAGRLDGRTGGGFSALNHAGGTPVLPPAGVGAANHPTPYDGSPNYAARLEEARKRIEERREVAKKYLAQRTASATPQVDGDDRPDYRAGAREMKGALGAFGSEKLRKVWEKKIDGLVEDMDGLRGAAATGLSKNAMHSKAAGIISRFHKLQEDLSKALDGRLEELTVKYESLLKSESNAKSQIGVRQDHAHRATMGVSGASTGSVSALDIIDTAKLEQVFDRIADRFSERMTTALAGRGSNGMPAWGVELGRPNTVRPRPGEGFAPAPARAPFNHPDFTPEEIEKFPWLQSQLEAAKNSGRPFAPFSQARQAELEQRLKTVQGRIDNGHTSTLAGNGKATKADIAGWEQEREQLLNRIKFGGEIYNPGSPSAEKFIHNGVRISHGELLRKQKGLEINPIAAGAHAPVLDDDPLAAASVHIAKLVSELKAMERVDLTHIRQAFQSMAENVVTMRVGLKAAAPFMQGAADAGSETARRETLHQQTLRHRAEKRAQSDEFKASYDQDRQVRREYVDRMNAQSELSTITEAQDPTANLPNRKWAEARLMRLLGGQTRRLSGSIEAQQDAEARRGSYKYLGVKADSLGEAVMSARGDVEGRQQRLAMTAVQALAYMPDRFKQEAPAINAFASARAAQAQFTLDMANYKQKNNEVGTVSGQLASTSQQRDKFKFTMRDGVKVERDLDDEDKVVLATLEQEVAQYKTRLAELQEQRQKALDALKGHGVQVAARTQTGVDKEGNPISSTGPEQLSSKSALQVEQNLTRATQDHAAAAATVVQRRIEALKVAQQEGKLYDQFVNKFRSLAMYVASGGLIYGTLNMAQTGFRRAVQFDSQMASVQGVLSRQSLGQRDAMSDGIRGEALRLGVPIEQIVGQAKTFAQTGVSVPRALEETRAALKGVVGGGLDPQQASEMLVAVEAASNGKVKPQDIIDRIARVEARSPVTAQDLAVGIQRAGSVVSQMQGKQIGTFDAFDLTNAMQTAIISRTRVTGNQSATTLRFLAARLASPDIAKHLQNDFGIKLASDEKGQTMRPLSDVLGDIAGTYKGYQQTGQTVKAARLLTTFAGARQENSAAALFDDWASVMKTARESSLAFGDAQRRLEIQLDTLAAKTERASNAFAVMSDAVVNRTAMKAVLGGLTDAGGATMGFIGKNPSMGSLLVGGGMIGTGMLSGAVGRKLLGSAGSATLKGGVEALIGAEGGLATSAALGGTLAAGASSLLPIIGTMLAVNGLFSVGYQGYRMATGADERDKFGPMEMSHLKDSDFYKNYTETAQNHGVSADALRSAVLGASARAKRNMGVLGLGDDYFNGPNAKTNPQLAAQYEQQYTRELKTLLPNLKDVGDESAQTAEALRLFKETLKLEGAGTSMQQSALSTQFEDYLSNLLSNARASASGVMAEGAGGSENISQMPGSGFAFSRQWSMGSTQNNGVMQAELSKIVGPLSPSLLNMSLRTKANESVDVRTLAGHLMDNDKTLTLGHALDSVTQQNLELNEVQDELVKSTRALVTVRGTQLTYEQETAQTIKRLKDLHDRDADESARILENRTALRQALHGSLFKQFQIQAKAAEAKKLGLEVEGSTASGGVEFSNVLVEELKNSLPRLQDELRKMGGSGTSLGMMQNLASALENSDNRTRFAAMLGVANKKSGGLGMARDRVAEAMFRFGEGEETIGTIGNAMRGAGVGYDANRERYGNAETALRELAVAKAQTKSDVLRNLQQAHNASAMQGEWQQWAADVNQTDGPFRMAVSPEMAATLAKNYTEGSEEEKQKLLARAAMANRALEVLRSSKENVLGGLPEDQQSMFAGLLNMKAGAGKDQQMILSLPAIMAALQKLVAVRKDALVDTQAASMRVGYQAATERIADARINSREALGIAGRLQRAQVFGDAHSAMQAGREDILARQEAGRREAATTFRESMGQLYSDKSSGLGDGEFRLEEEKIRKDYAAAIERGAQEGTDAIGTMIQAAATHALELRHGSVESMRGNALQGLTAVLSDFRTMGHRPLGTVAESLGKTVSDRLASAFTDNLFGEHGILGDWLKKAFDQVWFMDSATIQAQTVVLNANGTALRADTTAPEWNQARPTTDIPTPEYSTPLSEKALEMNVTDKASPVAAALGATAGTLAASNLTSFAGGGVRPFAASTATEGQLAGYFGGLSESTLGAHPGVSSTLYNAANRNGVDPFYAYAMAFRESRFDPKAKGRNTNGSIDYGLMQINDKAHGDQVQMFDTAQNAQFGMSEVSRLYQHYGDWDKTLAAYNWGEGKVNRLMLNNNGQLPLSKLPPKVRDYVTQTRAMAEGARGAVIGQDAFSGLGSSNSLYKSLGKGGGVQDHLGGGALASVPLYATQYDALNADGQIGFWGKVGHAVQSPMHWGDKAKGLMDKNGNVLTGSARSKALKEQRSAQLDALKAQGLMIGGEMIGGALGNQVWGGGRKNNNYSDVGSSIGGMLGSMTPLGPIGGLLGGVVGGVFGGLFKRGKTPDQGTGPLEKIERNTRETVTTLENQNRNLANLDNRFLNVPANFVVPSYRPMGVGSGATVQQIQADVTVNVNTHKDLGDVGQLVANAVKLEMRKASGYVATR